MAGQPTRVAYPQKSQFIPGPPTSRPGVDNTYRTLAAVGARRLQVASSSITGHISETSKLRVQTNVTGFPFEVSFEACIQVQMAHGAR